MKDTPAWRTLRNLAPLLIFLALCLSFWVSNPFVWLIGTPLFAEHCGLTVVNQAGEALRLTPVNAEGYTYSAVRLYRTAFPIFPTYQQRDIVVAPGDQVLLYFDCESRVSELHVCDLADDCYLVHSPYERVTIKSLEALSRPDAALEAAVHAFPKNNYSYAAYVVLCVVQIVTVIGGLFWLKRTKFNEMPKHDI